jgi:hypothetical protein
MKTTTIIVWFFILISCGDNKALPVSEITLKNLGNKEQTLNSIENKMATVLVFVSPQCPLSENYTKTVNDIKNEFAKNNVDFYFIIPGRLYSADEIMMFVHTYGIKDMVLLDPEYNLTKALNATVTPESFVIDNKKEIIYSGAIDNWAVDLGSKRQIVSEFYLKDAINTALTGAVLKIKRTTPVGCFIENNFAEK